MQNKILWALWTTGLVAFFTTNAGGQTIVRVNASAPPGGDGLSWATAFQHPQEALDSNPAGWFEIWVAAGTYYPVKRTDETDPRSAVFPMRNGYALYGGFAGFETSRSQRDVHSNITIFSGDLGTPGDPSDNAYRVVLSNHNDRTAILDGLHVRDGDGGAIQNRGSGLKASQSSMQVSNCVFEFNHAQYEGAAMYFDGGGDPLLMDDVIHDNTAEDQGGAVTLRGSEATMIRCRFEDNQGRLGAALRLSTGSHRIIDCGFKRNSGDSGAAIYATGSRRIELTGCTFENNTAQSGGGAILTSQIREIVLDRCTIEDNVALNGDGGGVSIEASEPSWIRNCMFARNSAGRRGGALFGYLNGGGLVNCLIISNQAERGGGVLLVPQSRTTVAALTIWGNSAADAGGGYFIQGPPADAAPAGCIFWNNLSSAGGGEDGQIATSDGQAIVNYSCVQGWTGQWPGVGDTGADPLFVDPDTLDFRVQPGSPGIDSADNTAIPSETELDFLGQPRFVDDLDTPDTGHGESPIVDMGAMEFQARGHGLSLDVIGQCPPGGVMLVQWGGAAPYGTVVVAEADITGHFAIPNGYPCAGTVLGLGSRNLSILFQRPSDAHGAGSVLVDIPPSRCGGFLQALDVRRCTTSNVVQLN